MVKQSAILLIYRLFLFSKNDYTIKEQIQNWWNLWILEIVLNYPIYF